MERDSMIFYREWLDALEEDVEEEEVKYLTIYAIIRYGLTGLAIDYKNGGAARAIYRLAKKTIESNNKKYQAGLKGGRPKGNAREK